MNRKTVRKRLLMRMSDPLDKVLALLFWSCAVLTAASLEIWNWAFAAAFIILGVIIPYVRDNRRRINELGVPPE